MRRGLVLGLAAVSALLALRNFVAATAAFDDRSALAWIATGDRRPLAREAERALGKAAGGASDDAAGKAYKRLAMTDPLAATPLVYAGAVAERGGDHRLARTFFEAAVSRDPRARAPHYFLALDAVRRGDDRAAIAEFVALNAVRKSADIAATLADYLLTGGNVGALRDFLSTRPALRPAVLDRLAEHPRMLDAVLTLAEDETAATSEINWRGRMLSTLVDAGRTADAIRVWPRLAGHAAPTGSGHIALRRGNDPLPFDWIFPVTDAGLASFAPGEGLEILYYGRKAATLATRDLLVRPGRYRLAVNLTGRGAVGGAYLDLGCRPSSASLVHLPLERGRNVVDVDIPATCPVQRLAVVGDPGDGEREGEWQLAALSLEPVR